MKGVRATYNNSFQIMHCIPRNVRACPYQVKHRIRAVTRFDGARGKKQVWRPHVRTWDLSEANILYWRQYLWHCWVLSAPLASRLRRRPELCLSTSQQPMILCGTAASSASYCDWCLIETWSTWSWIWLAIAVSLLLPDTTNVAGYDASRTASHRDLS